MIKFFRKIRQKLLVENRFNKYMLYAIGEIVLVVIGILIALQINNWNEQATEKSKINNYYKKISDEIDFTITDVNNILENVDNLIQSNKRSLEIIKSKNKDSLNNLSKTIGALGTAYTANFTFPIIDEFLEQGYLAKIKNDSIKIGFQTLKILANNVKNLDNYINNQYYTSIEPYFYKNINYADVVIGNAKNKLIEDGPKTDYSKFYDNLELYNLLNFKLESLLSQKNRIKDLKNALVLTQKQINKNLND